MAKAPKHSTSSFVISVLYAAMGFFVLGLEAEYVLLAAVVVFIAALLPDIDSDSDNTAQEVGSLLAAVSPLLVFEYFPDLKMGGISRLVLVVVCSYLLTRILFNRILENFTTYRGIIHSVPAAIITFELTYLLFWDVGLFERLFISTAAFVGYFAHLILDAYGNLDIVGQAMGRGGKDAKVLKFKGATRGSTMVAYGLMLGLGWIVVNDLYPVLGNKF